MIDVMREPVHVRSVEMEHGLIAAPVVILAPAIGIESLEERERIPAMPEGEHLAQVRLLVPRRGPSADRPYTAVIRIEVGIIRSETGDVGNAEEVLESESLRGE